MKVEIQMEQIWKAIELAYSKPLVDAPSKCSKAGGGDGLALLRQCQRGVEALPGSDWIYI